VDPVLLGYRLAAHGWFPPSLKSSDDLVSCGCRAAQRLLPPEGEEKEKRQAVEPVGHSVGGE
jgi:hypothetical protein